MVRQLNTYQLIFSALLILKVGDIGKFSQFNWMVVVSPLIIGTVHGYISRLLLLMGVRDRIRMEILQIYIDYLKRRLIKRELKKLNKN